VVSTNLNPPADGTRAEQLSFTHDSVPLITVSHALAFDAEGRTIQLELAYDGGRVSVTVPGHWVSGAALPLLVDPLVGAPVNIDGAVNPSYQLIDHHCDAAYNSSSKEWLVVWSEPNGASTFDDDLFARRVRSDGRLIGGLITIDARTSGAYEMAVSYASSANRYLVAWRTDPADNGSYYDGRIDARVVNANGTFYTGIVTAGDFPEADMYPASASDGTNFYVTWQHVPSVGTDRNIHGRFMTNTGGLGAFAHPDTDTLVSQNPRVAYNSSAKTFMIVWRKTAAGLWGVTARILNAATQTFLTSPFAVEGETGAMFPDVSAGGSKFLVVWTHFYSPGVYGRINTSGTTASLPLGSFAIRTGPNQATFARADYSTTSKSWYVVYTDPVIANELGGSKVTFDGALDGYERLTYNSVGETAPAITWNASTNEMLVVYRKGNSPYTITAQRIGFPSAQLYAVVAPPGQSELLRYDRGTITRTLLAGAPVLHGVS
jgi:hypothetical protein